MQVRQRRLAEPEHRVEIGAHDALHVLRLEALEPLRPTVPVVAGVVDEDVESAETAHGVRDDAHAGLALDEVSGHEDARATGFLDPAEGVLGVGLLGGQVADRDVGAFAGERDRDGSSDAGVPTGDERPLALEPAVPDVGLLPWSGTGCISLVSPGGSCCWAGKPPWSSWRTMLSARSAISDTVGPSIRVRYAFLLPTAGSGDAVSDVRRHERLWHPTGRGPDVCWQRPLREGAPAWHCRFV